MISIGFYEGDKRVTDKYNKQVMKKYDKISTHLTGTRRVRGVSKLHMDRIGFDSKLLEAINI